jgi:hypothetical protein
MKMHNETYQCLQKGGKGREKWEYNGEKELVQNTVHVYGIITTNPHCIIIVY